MSVKSHSEPKSEKIRRRNGEEGHPLDSLRGQNSHREVTIECLRLTSDGSGVGYHEGKATFVSGLLPGEGGQVLIDEVKKNWQRGSLVALLNTSKDRVAPPCDVFGICGGCQLQHLRYEETLVWKRRWVEDALTRIGKISLDDVMVYPTIGMDEPWRYRNKTRMHYDTRKKVLGYYQKKSRATVRFTDCHLISERMNAWIRDMEHFLADHPGIPLQNITFRENSRGDGMLILEFVQDLRNSNLLDDELLDNEECSDFIESLKRSMESGRTLSSIQSVWGINAQGKPVILYGKEDGEGTVQKGNFKEEFKKEDFKEGDSKEGVFDGGTLEFKESNYRERNQKKGILKENLLGYEFVVSPLAFLQVNREQTHKLYDKVLKWADLSMDKVVWDLYCGIGTITLALAKNAKKVWGIEENPYAIEDAKRNAEHNGVKNVQFIVGKVEDTFLQIPDRPDIVVLDPPRAGAHRRVLERLIELKPNRIVYVSCDPGTLARDLGILQTGGYKVAQVQPVDMFPWTSHVECIIMMTNSGLEGE